MPATVRRWGLELKRSAASTSASPGRRGGEDRLVRDRRLFGAPAASEQVHPAALAARASSGTVGIDGLLSRSEPCSSAISAQSGQRRRTRLRPGRSGSHARPSGASARRLRTSAQWRFASRACGDRSRRSREFSTARLGGLSSAICFIHMYRRGHGGIDEAGAVGSSASRSPRSCCCSTSARARLRPPRAAPARDRRGARRRRQPLPRPAGARGAGPRRQRVGRDAPGPAKRTYELTDAGAAASNAGRPRSPRPAPASTAFSNGTRRRR